MSTSNTKLHPMEVILNYILWKMEDGLLGIIGLTADELFD